MPFDPIAKTQNLSPKMRLRVLNFMFTVGIPFNSGLGFKLKEFTPEKIVVHSPPKRRRLNHVGTAHACALALMGEFPAGLLIAQSFPFSKYRIIIGELNVEYEKKGRGNLYSTACAPEKWPEFEPEKDDLWINLDTLIEDEQKNTVAKVATRWQVKPWDKVKSGKPSNNN